MYTGKELLRPALMTDLYQLTMAAGYCLSGADSEAVFELSVRSLPGDRSYLLAAGLEQAVEYILNLRFGPEEIEWLRTLPPFRKTPEAFFSFLAGFRFSGDLWAVPEGSLVFAREPILQVRAPLPQAQILETFLLSTVHLQTLVATKASRVVQAAQGRAVLEFGSRRAHGPEAGVLAARASFIGGCTGTSNLWAARAFGIAAVGTAAHSWTLAFPSEPEAFQRYRDLFPETTVLLIDTYDTLQGVRNAVRFGGDLKAVRIDSGNLLAESREVRRILDEAGFGRTQIIGSGDLNEYRIRDLVEAGAPIDLFGVGTEMVTSRDCPALGMVYKLVELEEGGRAVYRAKLSEGKETYPGRKQIWRFRDEQGSYRRDEIGTPEERPAGAIAPVLIPIIERGTLRYLFPRLAEVREYALAEQARLPRQIRRLGTEDRYPVEWSATLEGRFRQARANVPSPLPRP